MPEIEITEDQYEYLDGLRQDIQTEVAGRYATVRFVDALQYLIDSHEGDTDAGFSPPADDSVAAETDAAEDDGPGETQSDDGSASPDGDGGGFVKTGGDAASEPADDTPTGGSDAGAPQMAAAGGGDDDGILSAMMQLLETHDDRWQEVDGDTGYEVELPDGSTEAANTRDDVRALLYKHYE